MNVTATKSWFSLIVWLVFLVSLFLVCGAAVIMAMPLSTGFTILPPSMTAYGGTVSVLGVVLLASVWYLRNYTLLTGSVMLAAAAFTIICSLVLVTSVEEINTRYWPTPQNNKMASLATAIGWLVLGIFCVAKPRPVRVDDLDG